ncbi:Protein of unknown function [Pyronema omphalodes CBS 100304]|uniref:Uncharacterized protein n=1 Tax=Pyronema omphalodes (strain CBS 100304) TaxID=1076935 RepID=U4LQN5_PYROM|nr:Protein of unknown function [Pyronema omphalodes CBS 100304]
MKKQPRISRPNSATKSSTLNGWVVSSSSEKKRRKVSADEEAVRHNGTAQDSPPGTRSDPVLLGSLGGEVQEDQGDQTMAETEEVVDDSQGSEYEDDDSQLAPAFKSVTRKAQPHLVRKRTPTPTTEEIQTVGKETEVDNRLADPPQDAPPPKNVPAYSQFDMPDSLLSIPKTPSSSISRRTQASQRPRPIPTLDRQTSTDLMPPPPTTPKRLRPLPDEIPNSQSPAHSPLRTQHIQTPSQKGKGGVTGRIIKSSQWWDNDTELETQQSEGEITPNVTPKSRRGSLVPLLDRQDSIGVEAVFRTPQARRIRSQIPPSQDDDEGPLSTQVTPVKVKVIPNGSPPPNRFLEAREERENSPTPRRRIRSLIPGTPHEEPLSSASEDGDCTPTQHRITSPWKSQISEQEKTPTQQRHSQPQHSSPPDQDQDSQVISPLQGAGATPQNPEVPNTGLDSSDSDEEMAFSLGTPFKSSSVAPTSSPNILNLSLLSQSQTPRPAADSIRIPPSYKPMLSPIKRPNFHPTPVITSPPQPQTREPDSIRISPSYNPAISPIKGDFSPPLSRISEGGEGSQGSGGSGEMEGSLGSPGSSSTPTSKSPNTDQPSIPIPPSYLTPISPLKRLHPFIPNLSAIPQSQSQPQPQADSVYLPPSYIPQISPLLTAPLTAPQTSPQRTSSSSKGTPQFWTARSAATAATRGPASIWGTAAQSGQTVYTEEEMVNVVGVKETQMGAMETKMRGSPGGGLVPSSQVLVTSSQISQPSRASQLEIGGDGDEDEDMVPGDMVQDTLAVQWGSDSEAPRDPRDASHATDLDGDVDVDGDIDIVRNAHPQFLSSQLPAPVIPLSNNDEDEDEDEEEIMETPQLPVLQSSPKLPMDSSHMNSQRTQRTQRTPTAPLQTARSAQPVPTPPRRAPARRFSQQQREETQQNSQQSQQRPQQSSQQLPQQLSRQSSRSQKTPHQTPVPDSDATRSSEGPAGHQYSPDYSNEDEEMDELGEMDDSQLINENWDYTQDPDVSMFNPVKTQQMPESLVFGGGVGESQHGQRSTGLLGLLGGEGVREEEQGGGEEGGGGGGEEEGGKEGVGVGFGGDKRDWRNRRNMGSLDDWADKQCDEWSQEIADKTSDEMADKMADEMADKMADESVDEMMEEMLREQEAEEAREEERLARLEKEEEMEGTSATPQQDNIPQEEAGEEEEMLPPIRIEKQEEVPRRVIPKRPNFLTTSQLLPDSLMDSFPPPPMLGQEEKLEEKEREYDSDETQ